MTLQQVKVRIENLGVRKQQQIEEYTKMKSDLMAKVHNKQMYQSEAELRLENFKKEAESFFDNEYTSILNQLEGLEKSELELIQSEYEVVTADSVAELNLLSSMSVSEKELVSYLEKFKRNPLAIKKLHEIGESNNITLPKYILKEDRLFNLIQVFKQYAKSYHDTPIIDSYSSASDLAFILVLAGDDMTEYLNKYLNHFDTAIGLTED